MTLKKMALIGITAISLALSASGSARADLQNGSFELYTGGNSGDPSQLASNLGSGAGYTTLTGWTVGNNTYGFLMAPGSADTTGSYSPEYSNSFTLWGANNGGPDTIPATSLDGGNFLALDGGADYRGAGISQTLTGLTSGAAYTVSFYWAGAQQSGFHGDTTEQMQVSFGSATQTTTPYNNPGNIGANNAGSFSGWMPQSFTFTASGSTDVLNFLAIGTPNGLPPMVLLDGVSVSAVAPEPSSFLVMGFGLVAFAVVRMRQRAKSAAV